MQARKPRSSKDRMLPRSEPPVAVAPVIERQQSPVVEEADPQQQSFGPQNFKSSQNFKSPQQQKAEQLSHALATLGLHAYVEPFAQLGWDDIDR